MLEGYRAMSATLAASKYTLKMAAMTARHSGSWRWTTMSGELGRDDRNGRLQRFIELYPVLQQQGGRRASVSAMSICATSPALR